MGTFIRLQTLFEKYASTRLTTPRRWRTPVAVECSRAGILQAVRGARTKNFCELIEQTAVSQAGNFLSRNKILGQYRREQEVDDVVLG